MTGYAHRAAYIVAVYVCFFAVVLLLDLQGKAGRSFMAERTDIVVSRPEDAYSTWEATGVRGRVLVLFDRYPHITGRTGYDGTPRLTSGNLIEFAVFENIVRRIYLVVPDRDWSAFLRQDWVRPLRSVPGVERGLYLGSRTGVPLVAVTPSAFPLLQEPALVYINTEAFDEREARDLLSKDQVPSDVIITVRGTVS